MFWDKVQIITLATLCAFHAYNDGQYFGFYCFVFIAGAELIYLIANRRK